MAEWNHRACERCFFDGHYGTNDAGEFRMPVQVQEVEPGACCFCGGLTILGIFVRFDENLVMCRGRHEDLSWSRVGVTP